MIWVLRHISTKRLYRTAVVILLASVFRSVSEGCVLVTVVTSCDEHAPVMPSILHADRSCFCCFSLILC